MHKSSRKHAVTYSSITGQRSLPFTYRNLDNFMGVYSPNSKSHKEVDSVSARSA